MEEKINYQLSSSVNEGIFEVVITGEATTKTIDSMQVEVIKIMKAKNAKALLFDVSAVEGSDRFGAAYFRLRRLPLKLIRLPSAIVDRPENRRYQKFYETAADNIGHSVKFFSDIEAARAWLKKRIGVKPGSVISRKKQRKSYRRISRPG